VSAKKANSSKYSSVRSSGCDGVINPTNIARSIIFRLQNYNKKIKYANFSLFFFFFFLKVEASGVRATRVGREQHKDKDDLHGLTEAQARPGNNLLITP
jgi:hypothetical protein